MTVAESPSLLLQRAADKLTELSDRAHEGPWEVINRPHTAQVRCAYGSRRDGDLVASDEWRDNATWIATMSPAVAAPLVAWLRSIASNMAQAGIGKDWARAVYPPEARAALDFARLILGLSVEEETTQ